MAKGIGEIIANMPPLLTPDPDDTKYSLVMHGLCKKYDIKTSLERHIFSIIENMSRSGLCLYKLEQLSEYSGGTPEEIGVVLSDLERQGRIAKGKLKQTNGWRLTDDVRKSANWFKDKIGRFGKDHRKS